MRAAGARPRVLVAEPDAFDPEVASLLARHCDAVFQRVDTTAFAAAFAEFDAVWIRLGHRVEAATLAHGGRCRILACPATGLDHIDLDACASHGIRVISLKGEVDFLRDVRATAEHTIALMLALMRKIPWAASSVLEGEWVRDRFRGRELHAKTVGLVGIGRLGSLVAKMLSGFDVTVLAYDPRVDFPLHLAERVASLRELVSRSDIVSVHVTYDATTRHLLGAAELAAMQPGSYLINTSRGGVLDEAALLAALERQAIAGAALDVMDNEPHPALKSHPLVVHARAHQDLLIVPHIGGNTVESARKTERFIAGKVLAALGIEGVL